MTIHNPKVIHRIAPHPVSSGVSLRKFPAASLTEILKVCNHYETKCAGIVDPKSPAARYLFELSSEVQDIVKQLKTKEDDYIKHIQHLEGIVHDWNKVFAYPSKELESVGVKVGSNSPSIISSQLLRLNQEKSLLEEQISSLQTKMSLEISELKSALRDSTQTQRLQSLRDYETLKTDAEKYLQQERTARQELQLRVAEMQDEIHVRIPARHKRELEETLDKLSSQHSAERNRLSSIASELTAQQKELERRCDEVLDNTEKAHNQLKIVEGEKERLIAHIGALEHQVALLTGLPLNRIGVIGAHGILGGGDPEDALDEALKALVEERRRVESLSSRSNFLEKRVNELQQLVDQLQGVVSQAAFNAAERLSKKNIVTDHIRATGKASGLSNVGIKDLISSVVGSTISGSRNTKLSTENYENDPKALSGSVGNKKTSNRPVGSPDLKNIATVVHAGADNLHLYTTKANSVPTATSYYSA